MSVTAQYAPFDVRDGGWREHTDDLSDTILNTIEAYCPDIRSTILHQHLVTPLDYQETYGLPEGSLHHGNWHWIRCSSCDPIPGWSRYRTPVTGLFVCGSGTHPGGELTGACGYNASQAILRS